MYNTCTSILVAVQIYILVGCRFLDFLLAITCTVHVCLFVAVFLCNIIIKIFIVFIIIFLS